MTERPSIFALISANRRYGWALATPLATLAFAILLNAITSRRLAPEGFGQFAVMIGFMTLLGALVGLGMPVTVVRFSAGAKDVDERDRYRIAAWLLVISVGCVVIAVLTTLDAAAHGVLARWIVPGNAFAVGAGALGMALVDLAAAESQGELKFHGYFGRLVGGSAARVAGVVIALSVLGATAGAAITGYAAACLVTGGALAARSVHRGGRRGTIGLGALRTTFGQIASFGMPVLGSTVVVATTVYLDTLIVAAMLSDREVGWYAAAGRLTILQSTLIGGLTAISLPMATRAVAERREKTFVSFSLRYPGLIGIAITIVLVVTRELIVGTVYGSSFVAAAPVFAILSIGVLPNFLGNPISHLLYAKGKPGRLLWVHLAQLTALIALLPTVAARFGIQGVAIWKSTVNIIAVFIVIWLAVRARASTGSHSSVDEFVPDTPPS